MRINPNVGGEGRRSHPARVTCIRAAALILVALLALGRAAPAWAHDEQPQQGGNGTVSIRDVGFDPHMGTAVSPDLSFRDESGQTVRLGDYFGQRPVLLTLNYYNCQNLCPLILQSLVDVLAQVPFKLGQDFSVVTVSIDPANTPQDASDMKAEVIHRYARVDVQDPAAGWHFLSGDEASIRQLAQTVGFRYAYNAQQKDYAHPAGAILLTPDGRVARYLYGMDFPPNDLRLALVEASQRKIATPIDAVLLLCYHYDAATGRYNAAVMTAVRVVGVLTMLVLGTFLTIMWRRDLRGRTPPPSGA